MVQKFLKILLPTLTTIAIPFTAVGAEFSEDEYAEVNSALIQEHVLPRYATLVETTGQLAESARILCDDPGKSILARVQESFHSAMDAWMGVQHLRFDPIEYLSRKHRFYFWPEARAKVADSVREYLVNIESASPTDFAKTNVAVQGFLAAEQLLFGDYEIVGNQADSNTCKLLVMVTNNMKEMAANTMFDWQNNSSPFLEYVENPGEQNPVFDSQKEVTLSFFQSMHGNLRLVSDVKLKPVVGKTIQAARPRMAESRLSGRALRNIVINLEAQQEVYSGVTGPGLGQLVKSTNPKLDKLIRKAFRATLEHANSFNSTLEEAATNEELRPKAEKLELQVRALTQIVRQRLTKALGLSIGFNELDGD